MGDIYQYPVFFECHSLDGKQIKTVENYFRIRRRSGGEDCGPLTVKDTIYSVAFKHQKDQQAVLKRSEHVVELADGRLVFTVRGSLEPHASSTSTPSTANQDFTAPVQSPQSIPASTPPASGEEYELQRDSYLLRYLKEYPNAGKKLEKELASVACSAQLYPEEERVLVRTVAQAGAVDEVRNWKAEVDKVFDGYLCHYEVDPHKVKALLQSCSSHQTTDEVKVYSEIGMAVVVGEHSQVNARLMDVEDRSGLSEKQTSIRRLGKAKLRLLWKEIEHSLGRDFPGVKVTQGDAGQLVLEGSAEEIVKAGDLISDKEKLVLERTVSDMSPHVLAFLKKAYGGPGVLGDFLGVGDKVEVELRDTELRFFTLSADKLDDTEKALQGEIKEVKIDVPNCSVVPAELQEKLKSKTDEMNQGQYRAQVVFGSNSTVCLLGHTKEVEELSEFLNSHRQERVTTDRLEGVRYFQSPAGKDEEVFPMDAATRDTARGATAGAPGDGVHVEIIQGNIETQQVDALVSPMFGHDPLSTRVGNTLSKMVGSQLTARFRKEAGEETLPGDTVLVEGLPGLPSNAVFFLNLAPWDDDPDGTAVQVLRMGINTILTSCENSGFGSVALPVIGTGIVLRFPDSEVAKVLLEEVHAFEQSRASRTPFLVRIVIHPNDKKASEVFKSVQEAFQLRRLTKDVHQPDQVSTTTRIILLGKTGSGKSNLANTIFGEKLFTTNHTPNSGTSECQAVTKSVNGRSITLIDTPGFFDAERSEKEMKPEIVRCITECAPGPHAFLIVLKVEKFTEHEQAVITKICQYFSEDALKYAVIVFTHGNDLPKRMKIEQFINQNKNLSDLVKKCGGRCHVVDNKYWKNKRQNDYRSNQFQVEDLLNTIDKMVMENNGGYYTNKMFQEVDKQIQKEVEHIKQSSGNMPVEEIQKLAKSIVSQRLLIQLAGTATGTLLGAFFGATAMVRLIIKALQNTLTLIKLVGTMPPAGAVVGGAAAVVEGEAAAVMAAVAVGSATAAGGIIGGAVGYDAAEKAETVFEAAEMAANAVTTMYETKILNH